MSDAQSDDTTERAVSAWLEVNEDGETELCYDTEPAETKAVILSESAVVGIIHDLENGPSVDRQQEVADAE
jgi:hypothetical protein